MNKGRLEAFSDGVFAIIITIMVLELRPPKADTAASLLPLLPTFGTYILSFLYVGIYWNNHHHLLHAARHVSGSTLLANLHLLFWLSLMPFATAWVGQTNFASVPVAAYGGVFLLSALSWTLLRTILVRCHGPDSPLGIALRNPLKEWTSTALYAAAIGIAFYAPLLSCALYLVVAGIWFFPDRRIERLLAKPPQ